MPKKVFDTQFQLSAQMDGAFGGTFGSAQQALSSMQGELRALQKVQSDISGYEKQVQGVQNMEKRLEILKKEYEDIQRKIKETGDSSGELATQLLKKELAIDRASQSLNGQKEKLDKTTESLHKAGVSTDDLGTASEATAVKIDKLEKKQEQAALKAEEMGRKTAEAVQSIQQVLASAGIVKIIKEITDATIEIANEFSNADSQIAKSTGAIGAELDSMTASMRNVAAQVPESLQEVSEVMGTLNTMTGATGAELEDLTIKTLAYARVNNESAGQSASTLGRLMNALDRDANGLSLTMDQLTLAGQMSGVSVNNLSEYIIAAGPSFEEMGFGLERSIALFSSFYQAGAEPRELLSSLNILLNRMAKDGATNAEEAFNMLLEQIKEAPDILSATTIASEAFGARVGAKVADDIRAGRFEVDEWTAAIAGAGGTLMQTAEASETLEEKWAQASNSMKVAYESALGPTVSDFSSNMADLVDGIASFIQDNPELVKAVIAFGGVIGLATGGLAAYTVAAKIVVAMNAAIGGSMGPIMLVVGAVAALTAAAVVMSSAIAEAQAELNALRDANAALIDAVNAGAQVHLDKVAAIQTEVNASRSLIDEIYSLADAEDKTAEEKQRLATLVELLNESMEGLNLQYDSQTDSLDQTREAVEALVDARERELRAAAAQQRALEITRQQIELEEQLTATRERKAEIDEHLDSLTLFQRGNNVGLRNESKALGRELDALMETELELAGSMEYVTGIMDEAATVTATLTEETSLLADNTEDVIAATEYLESSLQALADEYDAVYNAALNSVQGQYNLWDKADKVVATATGNINSNLEGQAARWEGYNTNLQDLSGRAGEIEGLSEVIASFADGSKESVNAIAGMAEAMDEELATMVENWKNVQAQQEAVAESIAELGVDVEGETANIVASFEGMIADMELSGEARAAAEATISAYEASIRAGEGLVRVAIDRILAEVNRLDGVSASINFSVTGMSGGVDGSHAGGLSYVPWDDYIARLHKGERVLTAAESEYYTMVPQLINALAARGNVTEAISSPKSAGTTISIGDINVGLSGGGAGVSGSFGDGLKNAIIETVLEYMHDQERRAYT